MTTIATDGWSLAGDGRSTRGDTITSTNSRKVVLLPDGSVVGLAGRTRDAERAVRALIENPIHPAEVRGDYTLLRLHKNGRVEVYEDTVVDPMRVKPPYAVGSGGAPALGALLAGASPVEAVKIAAKIDVYTGGKITSYSR